MSRDDRPLKFNGVAGGDNPSTGNRRNPRPPLLLVAVVSLVVGAGGALLVLRGFPAKAPAPPPSAPPEASTMAGMPSNPTPAPGGVPGPPANAIQISPERQQLIGVRTATIGEQTLDTTIRTVGTISYDETRLAQIHTKISGWVDHVYIDYVGKAVKRGEPLFTIYSPELVSTQNEYLLAVKARSQLESSPVPATRAAAESLLAAARRRLELWDIPEEHIAEIERSGKPSRTLMLHSPFDGIVLERNVFPGQYVTPEMTTLKIVDLSRIWVLGAVFEYELPLLKLGQDAEIEFPYGQEKRALKGTITFISPEIDPQTRRVKIRAEFPNPDMQLKPETYVTVVIRTGGGRLLAIPKEAVIDTGAKRYALVALANGYFEPREIQVGEPTDLFYPIFGGLKGGDRIVTSAQFLIDSETNLQEALQAMGGMAGMGTGAKGEAPKPIPTRGKDESMKGMGIPGQQPPPSEHRKHEQ